MLSLFSSETEEKGERTPYEPASQDALPATSILKASEIEIETLAPTLTGDLDFSDLKRKKKKKAVMLDLDDDLVGDQPIEVDPTTAAEDAAAAEEFAGQCPISIHLQPISTSP